MSTAAVYGSLTSRLLDYASSRRDSPPRPNSTASAPVDDDDHLHTDDARNPHVQMAPHRDWSRSLVHHDFLSAGGGAAHCCAMGIPVDNVYVRMFDRVVLLALVFTSTVTVYIVCIALTQPMGHQPDADPFSNPSPRFVIDFFLDLVFMADFVLQFFRSFRDDEGRGRLVYSLAEIRRIHLKSWWLLPDFVSSVPFDLFIALGDAVGADANNLRFLRLIRLVRIHRASRIVGQSQWFRQLKLRVDSRKIQIVWLVVGLVLVEHWASCWWVWLGREEFLLGGDRYTWIDRLEENGFVFDRNSNWELYIVGLYWASTVSSSVGSGDIVPANPTEAIFVAFFQILGGCLFAYAVSSLVGSYSALRANEDSRNAAVDSVNEMLSELQREHAEVDYERIRNFVAQALDARAARARRRFAPGGALSQLSPQLRDEVLLAERKPWLECVWYLRHVRPRLARALAREAKWVTYVRCRSRAGPHGTHTHARARAHVGRRRLATSSCCRATRRSC